MAVKFEGNPSIPTFNVTAEGTDGKQYDKVGIGESRLATLRIVYDAVCSHFNNGKQSGIVDLKVVGGTNIQHGNDCPECIHYQVCRK